MRPEIEEEWLFKLKYAADFKYQMILRRNGGFVFTLETPKRKLLRHQTTNSNMIPKWKEQSLNPSIFRQASQFLKSCLYMGDWSQDTQKCSNSLCGCDIMGYGSVCFCCSSRSHHKSSTRDWRRVTVWWRRLLILSLLCVYHLTKKT